MIGGNPPEYQVLEQPEQDIAMNSWKRRAFLVARIRWSYRVLLSPHPFIHQEAVCQHDQSKMTMQAIPASALIVIQTTLLLRLFVELLNGPSSTNQWNQLLKPHISREIAKIVFAISLFPRQRFFPDEPALGSCVDTLVLKSASGGAYGEVAYELPRTACASRLDFLRAR